jgi:glycosyltransferase involved in cell wall biosynthesis
MRTEYIEWDSESIMTHIQASDVAIIPNSRDPIAICKSANRAVLALSLGVPVVASRTPAMEVLEGCVCFDDWAEGLYRYLTEPALVQDHLPKAQIVLRKEFGPECIARQYQDVLRRIKAPTTIREAVCAE